VLEFESCNFGLASTVFAVSEGARINDAMFVKTPLTEVAIGEIESGIDGEEEDDGEEDDGEEDDGEEEDGEEDDGVTLRPV
jgi:hypothetical protein